MESTTWTSNASFEGTELGEQFPYNFIATICIIVSLTILIIGTFIGNILVIVAVCLVRKLRRPCNYLIISLAVADLCVAILVMPVALVYEVQGEWAFGVIYCDIWVSCDVISCTASILNLCMISVDRYYAIIKPLEYGIRRTPNLMLVYIATVWVVAVLVSVPPILFWGGNIYEDMGKTICLVNQKEGYQIYATLGSFYIPAIVMLVVYSHIHTAARKITLEEKKSQLHFNNSERRPTEHSTLSDPALAQTKINSPHNPDNTEEISVSAKFEETNLIKSNHTDELNNSLSVHYTGELSPTSNHEKSKISSGSRPLKRVQLLKKASVSTKFKVNFFIARERKASTTLGIIMTSFLVCWLPFFILALVRPFVESEAIPHSMTAFFLWLGYANSFLNPVIYATLNKDFRTPFKEILCFRCSSLKLMMREEFYAYQYGEDAGVSQRRKTVDVPNVPVSDEYSGAGGNYKVNHGETFL